MDQCSEDLFRRTRQESLSFLAPKFFRGGLPEFLDLIFKIHPDVDHVAKFHGDRSRELGVGDPGAKQKINICCKI